MGRCNLMVDNEGPKLNATLWYMNMKNRFKWKDNHEEKDTSSEDMAAALKQIAEKLPG